MFKIANNFQKKINVKTNYYEIKTNKNLNNLRVTYVKFIK